MFRTLISYLTFPGVIIHELSHKKFCDWFGVEVYKVRYFKFGTTLGYVDHAVPSKYFQTFWISIGPLIINSILTIVSSAAGAHFILVNNYSYVRGLWLWVVVWIIFSIGFHAIPSDADVENIRIASREALSQWGIFHPFRFLYALAFPFVWIIIFANKLKIYWMLDIWYSIALMVFGVWVSLSGIF
ncbi:MAG: hypothetical protein WCO12_00375 [bacterium]